MRELFAHLITIDAKPYILVHCRCTPFDCTKRIRQFLCLKPCTSVPELNADFGELNLGDYKGLLRNAAIIAVLAQKLHVKSGKKFFCQQAYPATQVK
jgi:hypothetical protein